MGLKFTVHDDFTEALAHKLAAASTEAERIVAVQASKDTEPFVPMSGAPAGLVNRAQVDGKYVIYPGPYARYLYHGKVMVDRETGKGPMHYVDKFGNEKIRFKKGAKLKATGRNLKISKAVHPQAQSHWFEASKAQNLKEWKRAAEEALKRELGK